MKILKSATFDDWLVHLRDKPVQRKILAWLTRLGLSDRLIGDCKSIKDGIYEQRFNTGPGYRVYFARNGDQLVLLLVGGDKSTQARDIDRAKAMWKEWKQQ
ncbi:type II toxin-antitoxin system RelE/ParE family toxin [Bifidobacterium sp. ESL0682]|uniref:type II toxin-antitoxin system RelE/ParE family toxin n=1 Tax=Bifidobacterium sp. ESL0682 TaxID=2983212 RepID=UPI0023F67A67|nr:type II toxin-antitoxin system RelE/ParE family toxin [Bifidobacterium sp. ESL0682]WEV41759.1 type II toxin-antitoxin system RelE/ParE family toxin [Bifidobacterium sp. ESL0682]